MELPDNGIAIYLIDNSIYDVFMGTAPHVQTKIKKANNNTVFIRYEKKF
jgi:hypothetical protein